jgi:hypothetical protein
MFLVADMALNASLAMPGGHVFGGVHGGLLGRVFHGAGGDLLELLRQRAPPLQRVHHAGRVGLAGLGAR